MQDHPAECPDLEALARWLKAELEAEVFRLALAGVKRPHQPWRWLEDCDHCQENLRILERWQEELDHPDVELVARERPRAWRLWSEMEVLSTNQLKRSLKTRHVFWGMVVKLMLESREALAISARRGVLLGEIAVGMSQLLPGSYGNRDLADLSVRAWAFLGNALRVAGRLRKANEAFITAASFLEQGTGKPLVRATFCDLLGSLCKDQRRFPEAELALSEAARLYQSCGRPALVGKIRLLQGDVAELKGQLNEAIQRFTEAQRLIDAQSEPALYAHCQHHLVCYLIELGQFDEALLRLPIARRLWKRLGDRRSLMKLRWAEGRMYQQLGFLEEAAIAFEDVSESMRKSDASFDYALLQLDQAALYLEEGNLETVLECVCQAHDVLHQEDVPQECLATLLQLQKAVKAHSITQDLIAQVVCVVRYVQNNPGAKPPEISFP